MKPTLSGPVVRNFSPHQVSRNLGPAAGKSVSLKLTVCFMPQPITTFLRHSVTLKAAMADCKDAPRPKAVHRLRSTTRRMEAALELLVRTADLSVLPKKSRALRKSFRRLRRAAGRVRDLDVHRKLLGAYKTISDAVRLEKDFDAARKKKAQKLQRRIAKDEHEIRRALDDLETTLAAIVDLNLSGGGVAHVAQSWLATAVHGLDLQSDDDLHSIRKACKTGRYIAEIGSEDSRAADTLAKRLDDVQQTTGAWHDYLQLLKEVNRSLPEDSPLTGKIHAKADRLRHRAEAKAARLLPA
jgi:CHAD domain-containing protein